MPHVTSRSPLEFFRRHGIIPTPRGVLPRLDTRHLRLLDIPLTQDQLNPGVMLGVLGTPPPDRGVTDAWPPPQEVSGNGW